MKQFDFNYPPLFLGMILVLQAFLLGCAKKPPVEKRPDPDLVAISYDGKTITAQDILIAFQESHDFSEIIYTPQVDDPGDLIEQIGKTLAFDRYTASFAYRQQLNQRESFHQYHRDNLNNELYQIILDTDVFKTIHFEESEIRQYYDENKRSLFMMKDSNAYAIRGIWIDTTRRSEEKAWERANEAYKMLEQGTSFETVARQYSDADYMKRGKENRITPGTANPEIERKLNQLQKGEYTEPFQLNDKIYIFYLIEFIEPEYVPYEKARELVVQHMTTNKQNREVYFLTQELLKKHGCMVNAELLNSIQDTDPSTLILSAPGVYELTLAEFLALAAEHQKWTLKEKQDYLNFLVNKVAFLAEAKSRGYTEEDVKPALHYWDTKYLAEQYIKLKVAETPLTEKQMKDFYEKNQDESYFKTPEYYDLYHLFVRAEFDPSFTHYQTLANFEKARQQLEMAWQEMANGKSFQQVITPFTNNPAIGTAGHLGVLTLGQLDPATSSIVGEMEAGEICPPERIFSHPQEQYGYELFYVKDIIPPRPMKYEEARRVIQNRFVQGRFKQIKEELKQEFEEKHDFTINEEAIDKIVHYLKRLAKRYDLRDDITYYERANGTEQ